MRLPLRALLLSTLTGGCVGAPAGEHDHEHDFEHFDEHAEQATSELRSCNSRWQPSAQAMSAARDQYVRYEGAGGRCSGGATSGAQALGRHIQREFGHLINRRIPGEGVQIYSCRRIRGGRGMSLHSTGRAVDIFIPSARGGANNAAGDVIANWLVTNAEHIGVQYVIWDRTRVRMSGGNRVRCYTGSHSHADHIHVELTSAAARERTPFFRGAPTPAPVEAPAPAEPPKAWIGGRCDDDSDCTTGDCFERICVQSCAGYCPDRRGEPTTFCAPRESVGAAGDGGLCLSKAHELNRRCAHRDDVVSLEVERHVGASRASHAYATVCAPRSALVSPNPAFAPPPDAAPAPVPAEPQPMCGGQGVAVSNNGDECDGVAPNTWRCACSGQWDIPISQVCRDGRWLTYRTEPRDCGGCAGGYSSACD